MRTLRIALAQIDTTVGDLEGNVTRIRTAIARAESHGAELVAFPELTIPGYPPEDLLLKSEFIEANLRALDSLAPLVRRSVVVVGFADRRDDVFNAAAVLAAGRVQGVYHKHHLPNYSVFDEKRYFQAGCEPLVFGYGPITFGVTICEDMWFPDGPAVVQAGDGGAELLVCISASPFFRGKARSRERMLATRAADNVAVVAFVNQVGGQDELVFDGGSVVLDGHGEVLARARSFEEDLILADLDLEAVFRARLHDPRRRDDALAANPAFLPVRRIELPDGRNGARGERGEEGEGGGASGQTGGSDRTSAGAGAGPRRARRRPAITSGVASPLEGPAELYPALVLGLRDYVEKNGFEAVVLGLSGGIDSAFTAAVATDALGPERVVAVSMPSAITSARSRDDAAGLAQRLGIRFHEIPIAPVVEAYERALAGVFGRARRDVTEENVQARVRGNYLMALSNKFGWLVLATGNKSEFSVGYTTLYGDMAGGFAVLKDVPKTVVYTLARYRNERERTAGRPAIFSESVLTRPPSAELRPGQKDEDTLPPYSVLDPILEAYIEDDASPDDLIASGLVPDLVHRVVRMVDGNEYKRRQAPPGIKVTSRAFGRDRRLPISHGFRRTRDAARSTRGSSTRAESPRRRAGGRGD